LNLLIKQLERFGPLSDEEKGALAGALSQAKDVDRDEDIFVEGERAAECKVIIEGFCCRYKLLPSGRRQIMSFQIPGDIVDLQGFLFGDLDHSVATLTPCRVALLPYKALLDITDAYPRIARALWRTTMVDAAVFREWIVGLGRRSAYQRIAHVLSEVFVRLRAVGLTQDSSYELPVSQAELGDALGLSTVHVNRTLQELRRDGLIELRGGRLEIKDWDALKSAGEFDPHYLRAQSVTVRQASSATNRARAGFGTESRPEV
jgi:CRP-like cAMP-binding protein